MKKKQIKPVHAVTENDEYFYRHQEMFRTILDEDLFDLNIFELDE